MLPEACLHNVHSSGSSCFATTPIQVRSARHLRDSLLQDRSAAAQLWDPFDFEHCSKFPWAEAALKFEQCLQTGPLGQHADPPHHFRASSRVFVVLWQVKVGHYCNAPVSCSSGHPGAEQPHWRHTVPWGHRASWSWTTRSSSHAARLQKQRHRLLVLALDRWQYSLARRWGGKLVCFLHDGRRCSFLWLLPEVL